MYSLLTEFKDGDNVVTTMMEHNSNYVPWYAMCREILPKFGVKVECRLVNFSARPGNLTSTTWQVLLINALNWSAAPVLPIFSVSKTLWKSSRGITLKSGYVQPDGWCGSYLLIDGAQLVPGSAVDVANLDVDFLAFSMHKMLAPFGIGVLYARLSILSSMPPFLYGGDMIAQGQVTPEKVGYNVLPWKFAAGTPNILGAIISAQALRFLLDLTIDPKKHVYFNTEKPVDRDAVFAAMNKISAYLKQLTAHALERLGTVPAFKSTGLKMHLKGRPWWLLTYRVSTLCRWLKNWQSTAWKPAPVVIAPRWRTII